MLLLPTVLTRREAADTLRMLAQAQRSDADDATLTVDAGPLQRFDSAALAVLLECRRLAQAWGKGFTVQSVPAPLLSLAQLYGVDELLALQPAA